MKTLILLSVFLITTIAWASQERPNIVWISCEDMSPYLGCYGDPHANTPNIDAFAKEAIRFTNAWSTSPICAPARSTLITGRYSTSLGTMNLRGIVPQSPQVKTLPVLMREAGYYTTNNHKTDYNFSFRGLWDESSTTAHWKNRPNPDQPFFHVVNYQQTHEGPTGRFHVDPVRHDPADVTLPPYFVDTPNFRKIMARHYDLIQNLDNFFAEQLADLENEGLLDDTIIFFFSDHGSGFPRYKRWLYETGLKVPLLVHIPEKFSHLTPEFAMGSVDDRLVGFVDYASTVLDLAGITIPDNMEGHSFLGPVASQNPKGQPYLFGARDRADDLEDLSRAVRDDRYMYIRNFMPFRPYIREAMIFRDTRKIILQDMYADLESANPNPHNVAMFTRKAVEELYDLQNDPDQLNNLVDDPEYADIKKNLKDVLYDWILETRDTAFLPEGEMMRRGIHDSVYDMAQDPLRYDLPTILEAADLISMPSTSVTDLQKLSNSPEVGVRYWAAVGLLNDPQQTAAHRELLKKLMNDRNVNVRIPAAEAALVLKPDHMPALEIINQAIADHIDTEPAIAMRAARALAEAGEAAKPMIPKVRKHLKRIEGPVWDGFRNWYYQMFIGMALDQVMVNCGEPIERNYR